MHISRVIITNYKCLGKLDLELQPGLNVLVGDNETGKSTLLEAINLAITGQLGGRFVAGDLSPHLFNRKCMADYLSNLILGKTDPPPALRIEVFFEADPALASLKGTNNSQKLDCPGLDFRVEFDDDYLSDFTTMLQNPAAISAVPIEYYAVRWFNFAGQQVSSRPRAVSASLIDTSLVRSGTSAYGYVREMVEGALDARQRVQLALSYRGLKDQFLADPNVQAINSFLLSKKGDVTDKTLTIAMDTSPRQSWESGLAPHLDAIPFAFAGKGEQSSVKMKLAMEASAKAHILLIEEPENHLSYPNMRRLVQKIGEKAGGRQIIVTTHSSYVLNKLGLENVILFCGDRHMRLTGLERDTQDYFMKLPGHDTLRLILSRRAILVEGPSDELIVQKAHLEKHGKLPLDVGVDVISVHGLAFKRFLEIAAGLKLVVTVVTDNDGDVAALKTKYQTFVGQSNISINFDPDETYPTLEPQMLKVNGRIALNKILGTSFATDDEIANYMRRNKTDCALAIFRTTDPVKFPRYIDDAVA